MAIKGENILIKKTLQQANGEPLLVSNLVSAKATIKGIKQWVLGVSDPLLNGVLRQGSFTNELVLEITASYFKTLPAGVLTLEFEITTNNSEFTIEEVQIDIFRVSLNVEL